MQAQPAPRPHPPGGKTAAFRAALPYTLPICVGFLFLGMSYGFLMRSQGFSVWYPLFMSMFIFAGSMEFVTANLLLLPTFQPLHAFLLTLMVNARHLFYGLSMLDKGDHKYLALGTMSGFLSVPFGVFITSVIVMFTHPAIRSTFSSVGEPDHVVVLTLGMLLRNMIPLVVICVLLALGLKFFPNGMVKGFMVFGKLMTGALTLVVVACILQHYTGLFTDILGVGWGFDPILADEENTFRAVELLGTIAMMLTGAFPMVTLIRRYLGKPLEKLGRLAGLEASGSVGLVACLPNGLVVEVVANPQTSQLDGVT